MVDAMVSHRVFLASGGSEQEVSGPGVEEQPVSAVVEEGQQALDLEVGAFDASTFVLSTLAVEERSFEPVVVCSGACETQHEGNPILRISVHRHSARSRAAFHWASECWTRMREADRVSSPVVSVDSIALRHFSKHSQWQVFVKSTEIPSQHEPVEDWLRRASHAGRVHVRNCSPKSMSVCKACPSFRKF